MDREHGATEAAAFVKRVNFAPSNVAFDAAFEKKKQEVTGAISPGRLVLRTEAVNFALIFCGFVLVAKFLGESG